MKLLFVNVAKDLTSAQRGSLVALWLLSSVGFVGTQGCAHQPRSGPGAEAARTEIAQLEGNISSRQIGRASCRERVSSPV